MRNCTRCDGAKVNHSQWAKDNGFEGPEARPCWRCNGEGTFPEPNYSAIIDRCFTKRKPVRFRSSFTSPFRKDGVDETRAYYVWRLTRFHAGYDVTMPMTAEALLGSDPYRPELERLTREIAKRLTGRESAGVARWRSALYGEAPPDGLPSTAYESGPVHDGNKPAFEAEELK